MNLIKYGFTPDLLSKPDSQTFARVALVHRDRYVLLSEYGELYAKLKTGIYYNGCTEAFPTTGDFVKIQYNPNGDSLILATLTRRTFFSRRNPTPGLGEQAVAANFDYVFIMQACGYDFNVKRLERYLTLARQSGAIPVILLTKADLFEEYLDYVRTAEQAFPGISVYAVSTKNRIGLDLLQEDYLRPGKTVVCLGSSGIGKSSLINAFVGSGLLKTQDMRRGEQKGRHTTVGRQLVMLQNEAMMIDTPGMRELGMWDVTSGLSEAFDDVEQHLGRCRFFDCRHDSEPGCAVKAAIANGTLSPQRWESYVALKAEAEFSEDKETYLRKKNEKFKNISQTVKKMKKTDYRSAPCLETFTCSVCGAFVAPDGAGTGHRNHCPNCLSSIHVDNKPGDRGSLCKGIMDAIGVWVRKDGEWAIIHRCRTCGELHSNRIAADDNPALLLSLAVKPLASPPFPLESLKTSL